MIHHFGASSFSFLSFFLLRRPSKGKALEADMAAGTSAWQQCGAALERVSLRLTSPLVPVWKAPLQPVQRVPDLIPTRDLHPPPPAPTPADDFKGEVSKAVLLLAEAFQQNAVRQGCGDDLVGEDLPVSQRYKGLIFELNRSGAYDGLREGLKTPLLRVVREQLGASGRMAPEEMGPLYGRLYCTLMDLMHVHLSRQVARRVCRCVTGSLQRRDDVTSSSPYRRCINTSPSAGVTLFLPRP